MRLASGNYYNGDSDFMEINYTKMDPGMRKVLIRKHDCMDKYLPRLNVGIPNSQYPTMRAKRSCNGSIIPQPHDHGVTQLPWIRRSNSLSDSASTSTSGGSSLSGIPVIEITDSDGEPGETIFPLDPERNGHVIPNNTFHLAGQPKWQLGSRRNTAVRPRPPISPHPPSSNLSPSDNTKPSTRKQRTFKRSKHFELTLQNIEEVKDLEGDSSLSSDDAPKSGSVREGVGGGCRIGDVGHQRSHSTPVDYRELKKKIDATRVVSVKDMSREFTRGYLAKKGQDAEDMVRKRCIDWLKSLNSS